MRHLIWTVTAIGLISVSPVTHAANSSKKEAVGIGAGGVIGAAAGGPVGFILGAAIGAKLGNSLHQKDGEIDSLSASLTASRSTIGRLENDVSTLISDIGTVNSELKQMQRVARPELLSLLQAGIAMDLLFRTDEHVLADMTGSRLAELATTLASMPDIKVQLDGFADERGDADYNQRLSEMRVEFVRDQLVVAGVDASRIDFTAHGEAPAQDELADSLALERRVSLTLFIDDTPSFAANPE